MQFGDRLKALRKERKMTQRELADCLNISARVVQQRVIFDDITNIYYECWALNKQKQAL